MFDNNDSNNPHGGYEDFGNEVNKDSLPKGNPYAVPNSKISISLANTLYLMKNSLNCVRGVTSDNKEYYFCKKNQYLIDSMGSQLAPNQRTAPNPKYLQGNQPINDQAKLVVNDSHIDMKKVDAVYECKGETKKT